MYVRRRTVMAFLRTALRPLHIMHARTHARTQGNISIPPEYIAHVAYVCMYVCSYSSELRLEKEEYSERSCSMPAALLDVCLDVSGVPHARCLRFWHPQYPQHPYVYKVTVQSIFQRQPRTAYEINCGHRPGIQKSHCNLVCMYVGILAVIVVQLNANSFHCIVGTLRSLLHT